MEIELGKEYKICSDEHNLILFKKRKLKGKTRKGDGWGIVGYYTDVEHLANELVDTEIYAIEADTLQKLIKGIKQLKTELKTNLIATQNK